MEQSQLSPSIRNLEAQLGVQLFRRATRRTWLTRVGTRFYREAKRVLRDVDALAAFVRRTDCEGPEAVRLALGEDLASEPFTRLMFDVRHWNTAVSSAATGDAIALCPATIVHGATSVVVVDDDAHREARPDR